MIQVNKTSCLRLLAKGHASEWQSSGNVDRNESEDLGPALPREKLAAMTGADRPRLIIVCGMPGSGKTTRAKEIEQNLRAVRFCADEWMDAMGINLWEGEVRHRVEELQWKIAQQILGIGGIVVIEWGTWARSERDALRTAARHLGAAVELHFLDAPIDVLFDRIRQRNTETPPITFEEIQKWAQMFERPSSEEMALFDAPMLLPY